MNPAVPSPVRELAQSPELTAFCSQLERFLDTGEGADLLPARAAAVAAEARSMDLPPEHILYALRVARCNVGHGTLDTTREREMGRRYAAGIACLLRHYFGLEEEDVERVGDVSRAKSPIEREFRAEVAVRMVADPQSGALWRTSLMREGYSWELGAAWRCRQWLSCESGTERRYVTPVPSDWLVCEDSVLLALIRSAPVNEREARGSAD